MGRTLVQADPNLSSPPKRSGERGPQWTMRHKVPDRLTPSGMTTLCCCPTNTHSPARKTTGGDLVEGPGRVVRAK